MNKKIIYYTFVICSILLGSCNIESYRRFECTKLDSICKTIGYDDTIFVNSVVFKQIEDGIMDVEPINNSRNLYIPRLYANIGDMNLCLNGIDNRCWVKQTDGQYHPSIISNKTAYLLKWKSGYYNSLPNDILVLDKGIQQYGIPYDYREERVKGLVKKKEISKVLLRIRT